MKKDRLGSQLMLFRKAAEELGFTWKLLEIVSDGKNGEKRRKVLQISNGEKSIFNLGATTSGTDYIAMKMAVNKPFIHDLYASIGLPVPEQKRIRSISDLKEFLSRHQKIVLKPSGSRAGRGVFGNVHSLRSAQEILLSLKKEFAEIIAEEQIEGREYRVLVCNGSIIAVAEYAPPTIVGDGKSSIQTLIKKLNARKKASGNTYLKPVPIKDALLRSLKQEGLSLESVLRENQSLTLYKAAPISNGGIIHDVTDSIHPDNALIAIQAAQAINLNIAGVDIITPDIAKPVRKTGGKIIEINGGPDLAVHYFTSDGNATNTAKKILEKIFRSKS